LNLTMDVIMLRCFIIVSLLFISVSAYPQENAGTAASEKNGSATDKNPQDGKTALQRAADENAYKNAAQFIKLKDNEKALKYLSEYVEVYQSGAYRKEALKNIADIYYQNFKYTKALKYYQMIYEEFNFSDDGIEAYYLCGLCYTKMGDYDKAKEIYSYIVSEHPSTQAARKAKIQMSVDDVLNDKPETIETPIIP